MYKKTFLILLFCGLNLATLAQKITISGHIYESGSRELLIGTNVYVPELKVGTTSNTYGFYSLTIPSGKYKVIFSYVGYSSDTVFTETGKSMEYDSFLAPNAQLESVVIRASGVDRQSQNVQMSNISIPIQQIKTIPAFLGEKDVMKALQLMPGVQKGHEGSAGIYVRGGGPDQNLIILDDAVVYNANHLFGFFSLFNGDALKSVELTKGGFPARYGGRLSSVIDMNMKDGNKEKFSGEAGIGLISSRLTLDGPLVKNKSSFLVSGRRTYIDLLARPFMKQAEGMGGYYFYDLNAKLNYDFGRRNKLFLSGYAGRDKFYMRLNDGKSNSNTAMFWQNATGTLRWNHLFNNQLFMNTSLIGAFYNLNIAANEKSQYANFQMKYISSITDLSLKSDFNYYLSPVHSLRFGAQTIFHTFKPSAFVLKENNLDKSIETQALKALESGIYAEDNIRYNKFQINPGIRFSHFFINNKNYAAFEPRFASSYTINDHSAVKASFVMMRQYIHLLSNTGVGLPTDLWVPATEKVPPQRSWQAAFGYAYDINPYNLNVSVELYYKKMKNIVGYKEGSSFIMIDQLEEGKEIKWEENVTIGQGKSYGAEFLLQRKTGKLSGWIGYTLSWTKHQFDELNNGKEFWARYDRRHDASVVLIYSPNKKITLSAAWVYGSGSAITLPLGVYKTPNIFSMNNGVFSKSIIDYGTRNDFRMKSYHRLDVSIQFHKKISWGERTWEIGLYNAYNRKNPFYYFIETTNTGDSYYSSLKQISLFPIIPSISYSVKF